MPKTNTPIITPELKLLLDKLSFYREHITCTKCAATNTIHYIDDDPTNTTGKIKFQCSTPNCSSKPSTVMMEREIANLEKSTPYIRPTKAGSKIPKPSKSKTSRSKSINAPDTDNIVIDENEDTHIPTTKNDNQIETLIELVKTLQTRLTNMEIQLNNTNNKNAALHQQIAQMTKAMQLEDIAQNTDSKITEEPSTAEDAAMQDVHFNRHGRSKSTPLFASSQESKWAHPYTPGQLTKEQTNNKNETNKKNTNKNQKQHKNKKNNNKTYAQALKAQQQAEKRAKQHVKKVNIATRYFTETTPENEGFEYTYFPSKGRTGRKKMRKQLATLGAVNGRILDIHYPEKTTVALLTHKMYRTELVQQLEQNGGIRVKDQYDPTNPAVITNPDYANLSKEERTESAKKKHQERIVRALPFIRSPASKAVAKQFLEQQIITQAQHDDFMKNLCEKEKEAMSNKNKNKINTQFDTQSQTNIAQQVQDEDAQMQGASPP